MDGQAQLCLDISILMCKCLNGCVLRAFSALAGYDWLSRPWYCYLINPHWWAVVRLVGLVSLICIVTDSWPIILKRRKKSSLTEFVWMSARSSSVIACSSAYVDCSCADIAWVIMVTAKAKGNVSAAGKTSTGGNQKRALLSNRWWSQWEAADPWHRYGLSQPTLNFWFGFNRFCNYRLDILIGNPYGYLLARVCSSARAAMSSSLSAWITE